VSNSYYNLNSVSRTLASRIWNGIKDDPHLRTIILSEGQIVHHPPKTAPEGQAQISVYLYNVSEIPAMRNQPHTAPNPRALLYLNLRYLITPQTFNAENDMVLLGKIMQLFAEKPVLREADLQGSLKEDNEDLRIVLDPLSAEDLEKLWSALQAPYKLSAGYSVFPIQIDASAPPESPAAAKPILKPGLIKK
jgi:hypothetical protein